MQKGIKSEIKEILRKISIWERTILLFLVLVIIMLGIDYYAFLIYEKDLVPHIGDFLEWVLIILTSLIISFFYFVFQKIK